MDGIDETSTDLRVLFGLEKLRSSYKKDTVW